MFKKLTNPNYNIFLLNDRCHCDYFTDVIPPQWIFIKFAIPIAILANKLEIVLKWPQKSDHRQSHHHHHYNQTVTTYEPPFCTTIISLMKLFTVKSLLDDGNNWQWTLLDMICILVKQKYIPFDFLLKSNQKGEKATFNFPLLKSTTNAQRILIGCCRFTTVTLKYTYHSLIFAGR